uniref:Methyltransferase domain-containing protein n=1 Tax=viral metagenome TaxID=1070528 RepID=A0A6C0HBS4_9ZZZZ
MSKNQHFKIIYYFKTIMDYLQVYKDAFNNATYSNEHHIQYDFAANEILFKINDPTTNFKLIDIGSGRGQLINLVKKRFINSNITSADLNNFHNNNDVNFVKCNLSNPDNRDALLNSKYDILTCTDVFEHLDKFFIEDVIEMCSKLSDVCIFAIANHSDIINNVELHTIQENDLWWDEKLNKFFYIEKKEIKYEGILYLYVCISKTI